MLFVLEFAVSLGKCQDTKSIGAALDWAVLLTDQISRMGSLLLTVRIFCAGLYFATRRAVRPVTVNTMMRAALILSAARTAEDANASACAHTYGCEAGQAARFGTLPSVQRQVLPRVLKTAGEGWVPPGEPLVKT